MTRKQYNYVQCNACFKEQRCDDRRTGFGTEQDGLPEGWVTVDTADRKVLWELCEGCFKEVSAMLFAKDRITRVIEENIARKDNE